MEFLLSAIGAILILGFVFSIVTIAANPELLAIPFAMVMAYLDAKQAPKQIEEKKEES